MPHQIQDLVFLCHMNRDCPAPVVDKKPDNVELDLEKGTWSFIVNGKPDPYSPRDIGVFHPTAGCRSFGPIGVYDRTNAEQLSLMVRAWGEIERRGRRSLW